MELLKTIEDLGQIERAKTLSLVPTMGALHKGHLYLVELAKESAEHVCVSIFVNPLQFGEGEDFENYPKVIEHDLKLLEKLKVDYVFAPEANEIYKEQPKKIKANNKLANCLCGLSRPGHFDGVCTVVNRLFELIKPNSAVFGEKDYQQLMIIKKMVETLRLPVEIIQSETQREVNSLAMSSRNHYLTEEELLTAATIFKTLSGIRGKFFSIEEGLALLEGEGFTVEYLEKKWGRILFAGQLGTTRLIDNIEDKKFY